MGLPLAPLATDSVVINGEPVRFRSLSRAEALMLNSYQGREDEAEVFIIERGADVSADEAREWRDKVDTETAGLLIDGILILSGLATKDGLDPKARASNKGSNGA